MTDTNLLFDIILDGTATLFTGKNFPIGRVSEIVKGDCFFVDKTSLISEFIDYDSKVSIVIQPKWFGKTTNLTMLRDFFSIPIQPDYQYDLFKDTKIEERLVIYISHLRLCC